jgi:DNA-binding transcriptional ArsR family regulator
MDERLGQEIGLLHAQICGALADPSRILILYALADGPKYVNELKILRERSLVISERRGLTVHYALTDPRIIEALDLLRDVLHVVLSQQLELVEAMART